MLKYKKVLILYNIDGRESEASFATARDVFNAIKETYNAELFPLKKIDWQESIKKIDPIKSICYLATHGGYGEDGSLQKALSELSIIYTHSRYKTCKILIDKHATKKAYCKMGLPTPAWYYRGEYYPIPLERSLKYVIKKSNTGGSKKQITFTNFNYSQLSNDFIYESIVQGTHEVSIAVLRRGKQHVALSPIIRSRLIYQKYSGVKKSNDNKLDMVCNLAKEYAIKVSKYFNCYGITKTDFLINQNNNLFLIETDAIPGLSRSNASSIAAKKIGIDYNSLVSIIIENAQR